ARRQQSKQSKPPAAKGRRRYSRRRRQARLLAPGAVVLLGLVFFATTFPGLGGHGAAGSGRRAQAAASHPEVGGPLRSAIVARPSRRRGPRRPGSACRPAVATAGYVNPLAAAKVTGERIDQGVDYAGSGALSALGAGRIIYVGTSATGWPGAFIEYRLTSGASAGCFVYYAEGVHPVRGLHVGQAVQPGQRLAEIIQGWPTGIEVGWGSGTSTVTYAARKRQWSARSDADSVASAAGKSFSALVAALGGPAGRVKR
ncbi:MAG: hypothetical protein ACJ786_05440, partial [Catenulispora sp.]